MRRLSLAGSIAAIVLITHLNGQSCRAQSGGTCAAGVTYTSSIIWSDSTYNAFTGLTRYDGDWYVVFRTASTHLTPPAGQPGGEIRVLESADGQNWTTAALLSSSGADLRDPKITVTPQNQLMIIAGSVSQTGVNAVQSAAWFSSNGTSWGAPYATGTYDYWTWRTVWHNGVGYGISYGPNNTDPNSSYDLTTQLLTTTDGINYSTLVSPLNPAAQQADEAGLTFLPNQTAVELVRRDWKTTSAIGISTGNYSNWTFRDANIQLQSPDLLTLPDGRIVAAGRIYAGSPGNYVPYTQLCWLDPKNAILTPFLTFPDNGDDTGYPGVYWYNNKLWVSYHSSSPGPYSIYIARVSLPAASWAAAVSGNWSAGSNWGGASPSAPAAAVAIDAPTTAPLTVTLDGPQTLGTLQLGNSASAGLGYTLSGSGTNALTLDNSGSGAVISLGAGAHIIDAPVVLADNLVIAGTGTLAFSAGSTIAEINGKHALTMSGTGATLVLSGSDNYTGGTIVTAGTLIVTSVNAIADGTALSVGNPLAFAAPTASGMADATSLAAVSVPEPTSVGMMLAAVFIGIGLFLNKMRHKSFS
jgi:autotransporter-associated beta strand protein